MFLGNGIYNIKGKVLPNFKNINCILLLIRGEAYNFFNFAFIIICKKYFTNYVIKVAYTKRDETIVPGILGNEKVKTKPFLSSWIKNNKALSAKIYVA